jgi:hypothetical protein
VAGKLKEEYKNMGTWDIFRKNLICTYRREKRDFKI